MDSRIATIARFTLVEALRTRLVLAGAATIAILFGASFFVEQIAITESERFGTGFFAATARLAMVFIAALHVLASVAREFDDKGTDILLALDLPRGHYVLGKLGGYVGIAAGLAVIACIPLIPFAPGAALLQWGVSLALELAIVASFALFCALAFNQVMPAAAVVLGFYLLARALTAIRLMSSSPLVGADSLAHTVTSWFIEGLALLLPAFDRFTRTAWLVDGHPAWSEIAAIGAQSGIYVALLAAAATFDLYRKNF